MKKLLSTLCAVSLALFISLTAFPSFSASAAGNNIALDGYAEVDSVHRQYPEHVGSNMNDGNMSTRWQSNSAMTSGDPCIGGIFWHDYYTIDSIIIYWETSRPLETGYTIEGRNCLCSFAANCREDESLTAPPQYLLVTAFAGGEYTPVYDAFKVYEKYCTD